MKILQVSHGFPPKENAGVELYTLHLSMALTHLNHQVVLFCRGDDPDKEEFSTYEEVVEDLRVIRAVNRLTQVDSPRVLYDNHFLDRLFLNSLEQEKPDLVHFQHLFGLSAHLVRLAKEKGYPVAFTLHDFFMLCHRIQLLKRDQRLCQGPIYGLECASCLQTLPPRDIRTKAFLKLKDVLPFPVLKWTKRFFIPAKYLEQKGYEAFHRYRYMYEVFKACDLLLTPSSFVKDFFKRYYPSMASKMRVVPLGIPPFRRQPRPPKTEDRVRFCYTGNILPHKGIHILLDAFKNLPKGRAVLTIYGGRTPWNRDYYDQLEQAASGFEVCFRGPYQREDLPVALNDQDVAVLPAIWPETFSIVIREANLLGLPVIASRIGAIPEAIEEGVNGFLFRPGDSEDLRKGMLRFLEAPGLIREMASKMESPKTMAAHAREMAQIYDGLIGRNR
jgi:glycosyltransferase involved in cell wall biosynthesis